MVSVSSSTMFLVRFWPRFRSCRVPSGSAASHDRHWLNKINNKKWLPRIFPKIRLFHHNFYKNLKVTNEKLKTFLNLFWGGGAWCYVRKTSEFTWDVFWVQVFQLSTTWKLTRICWVLFSFWLWFQLVLLRLNAISFEYISVYFILCGYINEWLGFL
jgi:hypothetical protein